MSRHRRSWNSRSERSRDCPTQVPIARRDHPSLPSSRPSTVVAYPRWRIRHAAASLDTRADVLGPDRRAGLGSKSDSQPSEGTSRAREPGELFRGRRDEDAPRSTVRTRCRRGCWRNHGQPDVRAVSGAAQRKPARAGRHGARLLFEQQDVGNDARRTNGLERVFRSEGSPCLSGRPGVAREVGLRRHDDRGGEGGDHSAEPASQHSQCLSPGGMDRVPLRPALQRPLPGRSVSGRSGRRAVQADDPGSQCAASESESHLEEHGGARGAVEGRHPHGALRVRILSAAGRADRSNRSAEASSRSRCPVRRT